MKELSLKLSREELSSFRRAEAFLDALGSVPKRNYRPMLDERGIAFDGVGLVRMRKLLDRVGNPEKGMKCILVAGTSGKGSVVMMLAQILKASGEKAGAFFSPHLTTIAERIWVDGRLIEPAVFARKVAELKPILSELSLDGEHGLPSYFEVNVALALKHFESEGCRWAVLEAGLGGSYDATNAVEEAILSIVTNVGSDHVDILGTSPRAIARDKAGIIKEGGRALTGVREEELLEELLALSEARRAELKVIGLRTRGELLAPWGSSFALEGEGVHIEDLSLPMAGRHQLENAALAAQAALMLGLGEEAIGAGLREARLPGRGELMAGNPLVLLDGAHNKDKAAALAETLPLYEAGRRLFLLAMVHNKDAEAFVEVLAPFMDEALVTVPGVTHRLACPPERLVRALRDWGVASGVNLDPKDALQDLMVRARPGDLICATGSLFLVGGLRKRWIGEEAMLAAGTAFPEEVSFSSESF